MPLILGTNSIKDTGYDVANSLRLDEPSNQGLSKTPSGAGNRKTFTISVWLKRSKITNQTGDVQGVIESRADSNDNCGIIFNTDDTLLVKLKIGGTNAKLITNRVFRDVSAWYHIVVAVDTTQSTNSNRNKLYINGVQETSFGTEQYPSQDAQTSFNNTVAHAVGKRTDVTSQNFDGYLTEVVMIDGQALDPTSFGEFDSDSPNIWKPIDVSGLTFGTNGFHLDFENASSLGADVSGNSNNFTVNNLTSIDQSTDTCTNNFCTANILVNVPDTTSNTSNGNLIIENIDSGSGSSHKTMFGTMAISTGKWYWECKAKSGNSARFTVGFSESGNQSSYQQVLGTDVIVGYHSNSYVSGDAIGWYDDTLRKNGSVIASSLSNIVANDIMMVAVDCDNGKIYFGKNGTWRVANSSTFDSAQNDTTFTTGKFYVPAFSIEECGWFLNFGNPPYSISSGNADANGFGNFEYAVPSGYFSLCTKNLAEFG